MASVSLALGAVDDIRDAISVLGLPSDTFERVRQSLRLLETFPLAGRALEGQWAGTRFALGPWPWMILTHTVDGDQVVIVATHDARASTSALSR